MHSLPLEGPWLGGGGGGVGRESRFEAVLGTRL